jgi:hypothetical protein
MNQMDSCKTSENYETTRRNGQTLINYTLFGRGPSNKTSDGAMVHF